MRCVAITAKDHVAHIDLPPRIGSKIIQRLSTPTLIGLPGRLPLVVRPQLTPRYFSTPEQALSREPLSIRNKGMTQWRNSDTLKMYLSALE
jgi:hypothetical protein